MLKRIVSRLILFALATNPLSTNSLGAPKTDLILTVQFRPGRPLRRFIPSHALGAAVDGQEQGDCDRQLTASNIAAMLSTGLKSVSYRLRTELAIDVWHWNPAGAWSDPTSKQGYWTSDASAAQPIQLSYGYKLPRRGSTIDQANNDSGYSRLDDGDHQSFWKSNPYLDQHFTHEANAKHAQWLVIDFGSRKKIDTIRLLWGVPFATRYEIQYANFEDVSEISFNPPRLWRTFPRGKIVNHNGGAVVIKLDSTPREARFVRILMTEASGTSPQGASDVRDALGFAMREVYAGVTDDRGKFIDQVRHSVDHDKQTVMYVSSTDPWHRAVDFDEEVEQPGLDRIFQNGLTNGLPMLTPTGLLYDTPENAATEIQYLKSKGYPVERIELGEEPDGQYATPEDYGALYVQFAEALHRVDPKLPLGGPSFQEILPDQTKRKLGNSAWLQRFLKYMKGRGRLQDYSFLSFEWYPFDNVCDPVAPQLAQASELMTWALRDMERRGLSHELPWIISEYGYSAFAGRVEIGLEGALLNADIVGRFLTLGGDQAFLYGYTPGEEPRGRGCTAGDNILFSMDGDGNIRHRFATYFGARLLTQEWLQPRDGRHDLYAVTFRWAHKKDGPALTAYAVHRPDGLWGLLLINKDPVRVYRVRLVFRNRKQKASAFAGPVDLYQFSRNEYELSGDEENPFPIKSDPPEHRTLNSATIGVVELPPYSITVIRGPGSKPQIGSTPF